MVDGIWCCWFLDAFDGLKHCTNKKLIQMQILVHSIRIIQRHVN